MRRVTRRVAHLLVCLVGLGLIVWGLVIWVNPTASCRGETMQPGDVCHYASTTSTETDRVQTYEQRINSLRQNAPIVIGLGVAVAAFGGWLLRRELVSGQSSSSIGP